MYVTPAQSDSNTCGAWMIVGMVAYIFGIEANNNSLDREGVIDLMMILFENLDFAAKREKAVECFEKKCSPAVKNRKTCK